VRTAFLRLTNVEGAACTRKQQDGDGVLAPVFVFVDPEQGHRIADGLGGAPCCSVRDKPDIDHREATLCLAMDYRIGRIPQHQVPMTADRRKRELRMIGEWPGYKVSRSLSCWRAPLRPIPAHEEFRGDSSAPQTRSYRPTTSSRIRSFTPPPPCVLHEQRLTQMGMVWMEVADEDEDAAHLLSSAEPYTIDR
jgi:hypothetical protein